MKRWLYLSRSIDVPPGEALTDVAGRVQARLQDDPSRGVHADGSFVVQLPGDGVGPVAPHLRVRLGVVAQRPDGRTMLPICWAADTAPFAFPTFEGALELEPLSSTATQLTLFGSYVPPLGVVGAAADAMLLHRAAEALGRGFVERVAAVLSERGAPRAAGDRRTRMNVGDVMTTDPYVMWPDLPLKTAALMLYHLEISGAPVVSEDGDLVGVLTEADLLDKEGRPRYGFGHAVDESWRRHDAVTVGDACSRPAHTTAPDVSLRDAVTRMRRLGIGRLVVVDAGRIVGILTRHDAMRALVRTDAALQQTVNDVLADAGEADVSASAEWGTVRLNGTVSRRSRIAGLIEKVHDIDGVVSVEEDLDWSVDDVAVAMPYV